MGRISVTPIDRVDLDRVGEFLHRNLNSRISAVQWARSACAPWEEQAPNHGFMLVNDGEIVGVYVAFYSTRVIEGRTERFCNLGPWCVLPRYRLYSLQLLKALLAQPGYHFTDLSPSGNTISVNERLKFHRLDTTSSLMLNLPWPSWPGRWKVVTDPDRIERLLSGKDLQIYRDHQRALAAHHVVITKDDELCYVIFRRDRRKRMPLFASVLYASNPKVLRRAAKVFGRYLLLRHGVVATIMELRILGGPPAGPFIRHVSRPKMFKSESLRPDQVDNLYSELACIAW